MSCPKCGSGAVFQGKCRECGTVVDRRRSVVAQPAALGDDDDQSETVLENKRPAARDPDATRAPPLRQVPPLPSPRRLEEITDEVTGENDLPPPDDTDPDLLLPKPKKKAKQPDRSAWYRAAGMEPPRAGPPRLDEVDVTSPHVMGTVLAPAAVLLALAAVDGVAVWLGAPRAGLGPAILAGLAGLLVLRGTAFVRGLSWFAVLVAVVWGAALAVAYGQPLQGALRIAPAVCLAGSLVARDGVARSVAAGIGVAIALVGVGWPLALSHRPAPIAPSPATAQPAGDFEEPGLGVALKAPEGVSFLRGRKEQARVLPDEWLALDPVVAFANADGSFFGALLMNEQQSEVELSVLLSPFSKDSDVRPTKESSLVPDTLTGLTAEGWDVPTRSYGVLKVILARTPDGRAFTLFAVTGGGNVRNQQLFKALGLGMKIEKGPGP